MRSSVIWEGLRLKLLLLHTERSQLRWFGHLVRIISRLFLKSHKMLASGQTSDSLAWKRFGVHLEELEEVSGERSGNLDLDCWT